MSEGRQSMTDKREVELQRLAELATPGPWECREVDGLAAIAHPKGFILESDDEQEVADKRYIAAVSPDYVLQLLTKISQLEEELSACTTSPGGCGYWREATKNREAKISQLEQQLVADREVLRVTLEDLQDVLNQACSVGSGGDEADSMALSAYRDGLLRLAKHGLFQVETKVGKRVIGKFIWSTSTSAAAEGGR